MDFALWKAAKPGEISWPSPWGRGRPGWHIECSAMCTEHLGTTIDIHGGGNDLVFPHHENEILQSEAANGAKMANFWVHNGMLQVQGTKMSKSLKNFFTVKDMLGLYTKEELRFYLLNTHYRGPLIYSEDALNEASASLKRLHNTVYDLRRAVVSANGTNDAADTIQRFEGSFSSSMDQDFNSRGALSGMFDMVREVNKLITDGSISKKGARDILTSLQKADEIFGILPGEEEIMTDVSGDIIQMLVETREELRKRKQYDLADSIRNKLADKGIEDPGHFRWGKMEMDESSAAMKKAIILSSGPIKISRDLRLPFRPSLSTAGPGAGSAAIVLGFEGVRVKKAITFEDQELELMSEGDHYILFRNGQKMIDKIEVRPTLFHAPEQAFFNLESKCIYDCKFCNTPRLGKDKTKNLDADKIVKMIVEAYERNELRCVSLTSAVAEVPQKTIDKMINIIEKVRERLGNDIPIGVEPYISSLDQIDMLRRAGADEIKLNIETFDRNIFEKVCGGQDLDHIFSSLEHAVNVFGRGKVTSNIIIGMGETDENVLAGLETLANMGVVPTLRSLRLNDLNIGPMTEAVGELAPVSAERMLHLVKEQKRILISHDLSTLSFRTMCHECTCCDLVPFRDL